MLAPMKKMYDTSGPNVVKALNKRQFEAYYCSTAAEAVEKVLELIPVGDVVSWGGVATVDQLGIKEQLRQRGQAVIDRDTAKTPDERKAMEARYDDVADALEMMMKGQFEAAQSRYNG